MGTQLIYWNWNWNWKGILFVWIFLNFGCFSLGHRHRIRTSSVTETETGTETGAGEGNEIWDYTDTDGMHNYRRSININSKRDKREIENLDVEDAAFWVKEAQSMLSTKLQSKTLEAEAKNVIFFLGDGMSLPTITASRIFKGQLSESTLGGEEASLFFESFANIGVSKTFCTDSQVADSACSATAYLTGTKANIATIGVKPNVRHGDCEEQMKGSNQVDSILAWAQAAGKSTGVVTTTRITHASPAGTYAHVANRDWENDQEILKDEQDPNTCDDIAEQLILKSPGQNINVILGGGRREFLPKSEYDPEVRKKGKRGDGTNLISKWIDLKSGEKAKYVWNRTEFEAVNPNETNYLLGLFNYDHLDYVLDSREDPSLPELVDKAIQILSRNPKGFFLFVEGGRIDHAHHDTKAQKAFMETITLDDAVKKASDLTSTADTLILVTSDHAHTMSISGYPERGHPLLRESGALGGDQLPYTTISYANGPGYKYPSKTDGTRYNISQDDLAHKDYQQMSAAPIDSETHGGDDVLIFSRGPFSHLLTGVVQQSYIPHVVGYASCTGAGLKFCDQPQYTKSISNSDSNSNSNRASKVFSISIFYQSFLFIAIGFRHFL